jgi:hypothetical protein
MCDWSLDACKIMHPILSLKLGVTVFIHIVKHLKIDLKTYIEYLDK